MLIFSHNRDELLGHESGFILCEAYGEACNRISMHCIEVSSAYCDILWQERSSNILAVATAVYDIVCFDHTPISMCIDLDKLSMYVSFARSVRGQKQLLAAKKGHRVRSGRRISDQQQLAWQDEFDQAS